MSSNPMHSHDVHHDNPTTQKIQKSPSTIQRQDRNSDLSYASYAFELKQSVIGAVPSHHGDRNSAVSMTAPASNPHTSNTHPPHTHPHPHTPSHAANTNQQGQHNSNFVHTATSKHAISHSTSQSSISGHSNDGDTTLLCGFPVKTEYHPIITFWRTIGEIGILFLVFGLSFYYLGKNETGAFLVHINFELTCLSVPSNPVTLVPLNECGQCIKCQPQYILQAQHQQVFNPITNSSLPEHVSSQRFHFLSCTK